MNKEILKQYKFTGDTKMLNVSKMRRDMRSSFDSAKYNEGQSKNQKSEQQDEQQDTKSEKQSQASKDYFAKLQTQKLYTKIEDKKKQREEQHEMQLRREKYKIEQQQIQELQKQKKIQYILESTPSLKNPYINSKYEDLDKNQFIDRELKYQSVLRNIKELIVCEEKSRDYFTNYSNQIQQYDKELTQIEDSMQNELNRAQHNVDECQKEGQTMDNLLNDINKLQTQKSDQMQLLINQINIKQQKLQWFIRSKQIILEFYTFTQNKNYLQQINDEESYFINSIKELGAITYTYPMYQKMKEELSQLQIASAEKNRSFLSNHSYRSSFSRRESKQVKSRRTVNRKQPREVSGFYGLDELKENLDSNQLDPYFLLRFNDILSLPCSDQLKQREFDILTQKIKSQLDSFKSINVSQIMKQTNCILQQPLNSLLQLNDLETDHEFVLDTDSDERNLKYKVYRTLSNMQQVGLLNNVQLNNQQKTKKAKFDPQNMQSIQDAVDYYQDTVNQNGIYQYNFEKLLFILEECQLQFENQNIKFINTQQSSKIQNIINPAIMKSLQCLQQSCTPPFIPFKSVNNCIEIIEKYQLILSNSQQDLDDLKINLHKMETYEIKQEVSSDYYTKSIQFLKLEMQRIKKEYIQSLGFYEILDQNGDNTSKITKQQLQVLKDMNQYKHIEGVEVIELVNDVTTNMGYNKEQYESLNHLIFQINDDLKYFIELCMQKNLGQVFNTQLSGQDLLSFLELQFQALSSQFDNFDKSRLFDIRRQLMKDLKIEAIQKTSLQGEASQHRKNDVENECITKELKVNSTKIYQENCKLIKLQHIKKQNTARQDRVIQKMQQQQEDCDKNRLASWNFYADEDIKK